MKRFLSFLVCLALLAATGITAAGSSADGSVDERLKEITLKVKDTLGIGDSFTSFSGSLNATERASLWTLNWSGDTEQLNVTANESGRIVSFNDYVAGSGTPAYGGIPRLPAIGLDQAKAIAGEFLGRVLDAKCESVVLDGSSSLDYTGNAVYYLNGLLKLGGVDTPIYTGVTVNSALGKVVGFYRSDVGQDYGGVTKTAEAKDQPAAAAALKNTLNMTLSYALPGDGTRAAQLQYRPNPDGSYVVDAVTGKLVDLSKLDYSDGMPAADKSSSEAGFGGAAGADRAASITPAEQAAIDKMQGLLSQSALESKIRACPELGLTADFKLTSINYYSYDDEDKQTQVTAGISFAYTPKDETAQYRYIGIDARSGRILSVSSSRIYMDAVKTETERVFSAGQTEATARAFAGRLMPEEMKLTRLVGNTGSAPDDTVDYYSFTRVSSGIPFPENYISVGVDTQTGFVVSYYYSWYTDAVTFPDPSGAVAAASAADTYAGAAGTALKYVSVPASFRPSGLLLAYTACDTAVWGVDALTGELLKAPPAEDTGLSYNDVDSSPYAAVIRQLAAYGIGFPGDSFKPDALLTQEDALILIESTGGRKVVPLAAPGSTDDVYNTAYSMGILTPEEKNPAKLVSRAEFVKYLVNALGYGGIAKLQGIYVTGFSDESAAPKDLIGYIAIAKGLGIVHGDTNGRFNPNDTATRALAAVMLYNCMNRK